MKIGIILSFLLILCYEQLIIKVQAKEACQFYTFNGNISIVSCPDECCSAIAPSIQTACCSSVSLSTLAIPFFVVVGICLIGICVIYCRPLWKMCLCGHECPVRTTDRRINSSVPTAVANDNPIFVLNNDDLPDYETISKDTRTKDSTPPPYNFVTTHSNEFHTNPSMPSAPPQYSSQPGSMVSVRQPTTQND